MPTVSVGCILARKAAPATPLAGARLAHALPDPRLCRAGNCRSSTPCRHRKPRKDGHGITRDSTPLMSNERASDYYSGSHHRVAPQPNGSYSELHLCRQGFDHDAPLTSMLGARPSTLQVVGSYGHVIQKLSCSLLLRKVNRMEPSGLKTNSSPKESASQGVPTVSRQNHRRWAPSD